MNLAGCVITELFHVIHQTDVPSGTAELLDPIKESDALSGMTELFYVIYHYHVLISGMADWHS